MILIKGATVDGTTLKLRLHNDSVLTFEDCWLRDHCRCPECYHSSTNQRAHHILDIPEVMIQSVKTNDTNVEIKWNDGHKSTYNVNFLEPYGYENWKLPKWPPVLWCGDSVATKIARISDKEFVNNIEGEKKVFQSLLDYGIAVIEQVEPTMEATEVICQALGGVQHTMFGGMWKVSTNPEHADTAYMNIALKQHTDNTYFTEPAGLQIFHCTEHTNGTGGENVFIDGFYAAMKLKEEHPEDFEFLTKFEVEAQYIGDGRFQKHSAPVIQLDTFNNIKHIRFNSYDRSPMTFKNSQECRTYYRALRNLARYFEDPKNQWQIKLIPGTLIAFDNFRVLHGRTAFTGKRILCGSYVSRSDWLDKARTLGLL
ncbi:trimethyllysine dioxygenase, mitochondrial-like isoform X3 [Pieris napi]|uniref:trimethyllysine dioxygenase, mitochondrial-like isoform X3 n=1 Tax=Pieris napi TaxID=78633 RepID=UPI001FBAE847|nr:trimethyllysine dioxygenase, mitochondrial-like isoform X3 [Pieris napi]